MKIEKIGVFGLLVSLGALSNAYAQPLNQLNCIDLDSNQSVTIVTEGDPGAPSGSIKLTAGEKNQTYTGTFQHTGNSHSRVILDHLKISGQATENSANPGETVEALLSSLNVFDTYSGSVDFKDAKGQPLSHLNVTCENMNLVTAPPVNVDPLPLPPLHCGRCPF